MAIKKLYSKVPMLEAIGTTEFNSDLLPNFLNSENYRGGTYTVYDDEKKDSPLVVFLGGDGVGLSSVASERFTDTGYNFVQLFEPDSSVVSDVDVSDPIFLASDLSERERIVGLSREYQNNIKASHMYCVLSFFINKTIVSLGLNPSYIVFVGHSRGAATSVGLRNLVSEMKLKGRDKIKLWIMNSLSFARDTSGMRAPFRTMQYFSRLFHFGSGLSPAIVIINESDVRSYGGTTRLLFESSLSVSSRGDVCVADTDNSHNIDYDLITSWLVSISNGEPLSMPGGGRLVKLSGELIQAL